MTSPLAAHRAAAATLIVAALGLASAARADDAAAPALPASAPVAAASSPADAASGVPGAATAAVSAPDAMPSWTLAALPDDVVPFQGMPNMDAAGGGAGAMLYPAPNLIAMLAVVATHALIQNGVDAHEKSQMQIDADKVLDPYRGALAGFHLHELQQRAIEKAAAGPSAHLRVAAEAPPTDWVVQAVPVFAMTPDASALVLDDVVSVRAANVSTPAFEQTVRIVTPARGGNLAAQWNADGGAALKATAVAMMAEAIDIALDQARHPIDDKAAAFRTIRYVQGGVPKIERAQLVSESCGRMVIRTLRGGLMSVPHRLDATLPEGCPEPAAVAAIVVPAAPKAPVAPASAPAVAAPVKEAAAAPVAGS